jgi:glycosyltransferase involved in cell wall biosynthesis
MNENLDRFDVVIIHGLWSYHSFAASRIIARKRRRNPSRTPQLFVMPHGMLDPWFQTDPSRRFKAIRNSIYWQVAERHVIGRADAVLFTSREEKRLARTTFFGYRPGREIVTGFGTVAPPPCDPGMEEQLARACPTLGPGPFLLFLGRIDPKKGLGILLPALADHIATMPAEGRFPRLLLAGPGWDSPHGRRIRELIGSDPLLREHVVVSGMLEGGSKWAALHRCEAFILTSHQENFGVAVAEALSCGSPVLISDKVNIWPEVRDAGGGLVEEDTVRGATALLLNWFGLAPAQREAMRKAAHEAYLRHFRMEDCARAILHAAAHGRSRSI